MVNLKAVLPEKKPIWYSEGHIAYRNVLIANKV